MEALAIPFLLLVGSLLALQAAANVQLSTAVGSPVAASTLQLAVGASLLVAAAVAVGALTAFDTVPRAQAWHLIGGLGSALYITAGILLFPRLGAVVAVGLFIAGQMLASLLLDAYGWLGVHREPLDSAAIVGVGATVIGTSLIVRAQTGAGVLGPALRGRAGWIALGLGAGAALPFQGAINAQLRSDLNAPVAAGAFSFLVATAAMALVLAAYLRLTSSTRPSISGLRGLPWWGWLGGLCGAVYVTSVFVLIPKIGAAPTIALTVGGQQLASVLVDRFGLLRLPRRAIPATRILGVVLLLAGVALIQVA